MKKLGKMLPLFLLVCMLTFAAGCGSDKNNKNQDDMAGNSSTESLPQSGSSAAENDTLAGTEAFDGTNADDGSLNNSVTDPGTGTTASHTDDAMDTVPGTAENGSAMDETGNQTSGTENGTENGAAGSTGNDTARTGRTAGNAVDDIGDTVGNVIDDAGKAVKDMADDVGNGVKDITDTNR